MFAVVYRGEIGILVGKISSWASANQVEAKLIVSLDVVLPYHARGRLGLHQLVRGKRS